jgi:alpha-amylase
MWLSGYNTSSVLYNQITDLNVFRKHFSNSTGYLTYMSQPILSTTNTLALKKGLNGTQSITIINNDGASGKSRNITLGSTNTGFVPGDVLTDVVSCTNTTVDSNGDLEATIQNGLPNVFYPAKLLVGSTICVNGKTSLPAPVVPQSTSTSTATGTTSKPTGSGSATSSSSPGTSLKSGAEKGLHQIGMTSMIFCAVLILAL